MSLLSSSEIAAMRALQESAFPDTCDLYSIARVSDGAGGSTRSRSLEAAGVACRIQRTTRPMDTMMDGTGDRVATIDEYEMVIPYGQAVEAGWEADHNGNTYQINAVHGDHSYRTGKRCAIRIVD